MKLIFLGTPDFAVEALKSIYNSSNEILAVITQPDKPVGRKAVITPCAVKVCAQELSLKTLSYDKISVQGVEDIKALNPDIMVTCAYGQILSKEILEIPKYGVINIHASLLPKYRGASPIQWSILNGDSKTGVTIMKTELGVDTGDIISQVETPILENETAGELFDRLSKIGAELIVKVLEDYDNNLVTFTKQDDTKAIKVGLIKKEDGKIDFNRSSEDIKNQVRAFNPWPIAFTKYEGKTLKIYSCDVVDYKGLAGETLFADRENGLVIATKDKAISVKELQLEGGKKMSVYDFLLGRKIPLGYKFGE